MRKGRVISIGNELLIGDTINTNAAWLGRFLTEKGFINDQILTLPDKYDAIFNAVHDAAHNVDLTIITGGLGPTHDDITKKVLADLFESKLIENEKVLDHIKSIFEKRGFTFSKSNADQALVPDNCEVLFNNQGTAPGMLFNKNGRIVVALPGVPYEMKWIIENQLAEKLPVHFPDSEVWATKYYKTAGVPESTLSDDVIGDLSDFLINGVEVAYLPYPGGVTIRAGVSAISEPDADKKLSLLNEFIYKKAEDIIFGEGREYSLSEAVGELLVRNSKTIAVAESCTGGLLSNNLTDIPGSSRYVKGGIVAYDNKVKTEQLQVSDSDLETFGAVSKQVALEMAKGVAIKFNADVGVSTTGIAGPDGGSAEKPVGTVWIGFWINGDNFALKALFTNDRIINKERSVMVALETIRRRLKGLKSYPYNLKPEFL